MKRTSKFIVGCVLLVFGVLWALNIFELITFDVFFTGWWTLFIIVPSVCGLVNEKDKTWPAVGLGVGCLMLLSAQNVLDTELMWKLALAVLTIIVGLGMMIGRRTRKYTASASTVTQDGKDIRRAEVAFGEQQMDFDGVPFEGADVKVNFGSIKIDLRSATISDDVVLKVDVNFGGIELLLPSNLKVMSNVQCSLAGVADRHKANLGADSKTLFIEGKCSFAGITIK